jgi:thiol-disulfide isomerase/thioredoxin
MNKTYKVGRPVSEHRDRSITHEVETLEDMELAHAQTETGYIANGEAQQARLLSTPGRTFMLVGSLVLLVVVFSAIVWLLSTRNQTTTQSASGTADLPVAPVVEALAPDFELVDVRTNRTLKLSDLRGKPVFLNFWGTWCPPCRAEMPEMQKFYNQHKGQLEMIGISMGPRDTPDMVRSFVDQYSYTWTFIHDADYSVATTYRIQAVPTSYFLNSDGVIKAVNIGPMDAPKMEEYLRKIR